MRMSFEERLGSHLKRVEQELTTAKAAAVKPAGRKALDRADERAAGVERRLAAAFTAEELDTLRTLLARVSESLTNDPLLKSS